MVALQTGQIFMLQIVGDSAAIQVAIHSAFQPGFSARSLWRAWRGNMLARSTFNIVAAECRKAFLYGESCGGYKKKKMKVLFPHPKQV